MNTKQLGVTRQLLTLVISLVATGCFVAGEYRRQAERIDDHLRIRFDEFRGWTKIEPEKRRLREAVTIYLRENPEVDPRIKRHLALIRHYFEAARPASPTAVGNGAVP
jgi:hypothetical protein